MKQRAIKTSSVIDKLCSYAYENGLPSTSLSKLIDIVTLPNELDQASFASLIKNSYPAGKVPDGIVIKVVGCLGHGKARPKYTAQAALLKWLVMVYDVLENQRILSQLYAILFNLLDTIALRYVSCCHYLVSSSNQDYHSLMLSRTPLCHVLALITRRRHVRSYRIQTL
jgi:centromere protein I